MTTDEAGVVVDLLAAEFDTAGQTQRCNPTFGILCGPGEDLEIHVADQVGDIDEFEIDPQIRPVRTVALHGFGVSHARKRVRQLDVEHGLEHIAHQRLHRCRDDLLIDETHLDVELCELGLPVRPQVLVAETTHDLVVAIQAGHHQQLLEDLR